MKKKSTHTRKFILKAVFTLFIFIPAFNTYGGIIDTLREYNPASGLTAAYTGYESYIGLFKPLAPGYIESLVIGLGGNAASGSVTVHIYGQEGGSSVPEIQKDLITPIVVNKTARGILKIPVHLPDSVYIDNTQFFIAISNVSSGVVVLACTDSVGPYCSSTSGGDYWYEYIEQNIDTIYYDTHAYAIDVIMNYDETASPAWYEDVTLQAGIDTGISARSIAWGDFNNDGYEDLIVSGRLYKNNGNGTFTDLTVSSGISASGINASVNGFVDMNNDGLLDVLIIGDYNKNAIFINNGNETFTEHDLTGMPVDSTTTCFSIADWNNDKYPDLFLGQLWREYPTPLPNYLFTNNQNLGFTNVSTMLYPADGSESKQTYACMFMDYNNDGKSDLYVANYYLQPDELWQNNGDTAFTNICQAKGIDINPEHVSGHGTGVDWADYDNDGDMDLLLMQLAHPAYLKEYDYRSTTLYRNNGPPDFTFTDLIGQQANNPGLTAQGIEFEETQAGGEWGDINNDGLQDIFMTSYYGCRYVKLYLQKPDHTFELKTFDFGLADLVHCPDMAFADYDNDGKLDIGGGQSINDVNNSHFRLFKNNGPFYGNFLEVDLKSTSQNDFAIGGRVTVYAGGQQYLREVDAGQGGGMQKPYRLHFGLGNNNTIDSVLVKWPNNTATEKFTNIQINSIYSITEGGSAVQGVNNLTKASAEGITVSPNPFNDETNFNYNVVNAGDVKLDIYSLVGQQVRSLVNAFQSPGSYRLAWDGKDDSGNKLPSGFYMVCLRLHDAVITKKIVKVTE